MISPPRRKEETPGVRFYRFFKVIVATGEEAPYRRPLGGRDVERGDCSSAGFHDLDPLIS